ncbi:hypothetical protein AALP_AA6G339800 [Arabis alpina]|uniref:Uncharacterized protein n=1 Tax=Arabis alpina TaxID=50452 RepID=A0A087GTH1_ARAAL|nr:hypothetical protein AALP_AA6G339800 [Arabis alpina]
MADHHHHHHHHQHRPNRLSVPPRTTTTRSYPCFPYTPTPTPSKTRLRSIHGSSTTTTKSSISLRSLYSLLPFLRSSPSFSLFPFSFLVSLLSFFFSLTFTLFSPSKKASITSLTSSQIKLLLTKSLFLAIVFLLRFQSLRYCSAAAMILAELSAAMILAELSGTISARVVVSESVSDGIGMRSSKIQKEEGGGRRRRR